jgi:hypothetical protein
MKLIAPLAALAAAGIMLAPAAHAQTVPTTSQLDSEFTSFGADVASSALLASGQVLWVGGDTLQDGQTTFCSPTACAYGYPHDSFWLQSAPGSLTLTPVTRAVCTSPGVPAGCLPYGIQEIPNNADGTFYWPTGVVSTSSGIFVLCVHMSADSSTELGSAIAVFSTTTLDFDRIVNLPVNDMWSSAVRVSGGWDLAGTDEPDAGSAAKEGDTALVPVGDWQSPSKWTLHQGVIPVSDDPGTAIALSHTSAGWQAWTKLGDGYGSNSAEELTASSVTGPWTVTATIPLPYAPGTITYSVMTHPEQPAPAGQILLSYAVQGTDSPYDQFDLSNYHPLFLYADPPARR